VKIEIRNPAGFTLTEVIVASSLGALVMAAVLSSFVFLGRNLTRLANYQTLETKSRQALTYLRRDFSLAKAVKTGTTPTSTTVTLVLPTGEVTYTYEGLPNFRLRRQATFGPNPDFYLLKNDYCDCVTFALTYYTTTGANTLAPFSIKQVDVRYGIKTPATFFSPIRTSYETVSSRFLIRNKELPDGS
jgi:prepilin-type N-terminal cleavage/methylation domain-containing protein